MVSTNFSVRITVMVHNVRTKKKQKTKKNVHSAVVYYWLKSKTQRVLRGKAADNDHNNPQ